MRLFLSVFLVGMSGDFGISVTFLFIVLILLFILSGFTVDMWQSHQANIRTGYNALSYNEWIHKKTTVFFVQQAEIRFFFSPFISGWNALLMGDPVVNGHHPFSLLSFVKLLPVRQMLKVDFEGSWRVRLKRGWGDVLSFLIDWLSECFG